MLPVMPRILSKCVKLHNGLKAARLTAVCIGMISIGSYWYVFLSSNHTWADIHIPKYFLRPATRPDVALWTILQLNCFCVFGSAFTWLGYQLNDLKTAGLFQASWLRMVTVSVMVGVVFGPGSLWWLGWTMREEILSSLQPVKNSKKNN